jgi:diaminopimelate epimerase
LNLPFFKYQGTGNDFVIIDDRECLFPENNHEMVSHICDRRFGIGADGLILLQPHPEADFYMKYYNADGNESSMCGNGGRCIAAFAAQLGAVSERTRFMAIDGMHDAIIGNNEPYGRFVKLKMQDVLSAEKRTIDTFVLNTGSPHYVQFTHQNIDELELVNIAKKIRFNEEFAGEGINVNMVNYSSEALIRMRTYERGVEDETLSCGTGVTAASLALALYKKLPSGHYSIHVKTPGGELKVSYDFDAEASSFLNIWLQGPATFVFKGFVEV